MLIMIAKIDNRMLLEGGERYFTTNLVQSSNNLPVNLRYYDLNSYRGTIYPHNTMTYFDITISIINVFEFKKRLDSCSGGFTLLPPAGSSSFTVTPYLYTYFPHRTK